MGDRACPAQLVPDGKRIVDPARIEVIEIRAPIDDRRTGAHGAAHSSMMSVASMMAMAISGQLASASRALPTRSGGTVPSPTGRALPSSSSAKSSGATTAQRAWPWQRERSICTLGAPAPGLGPDGPLMTLGSSPAASERQRDGGGEQAVRVEAPFHCPQSGDVAAVGLGNLVVLV